ncbi:MAG: hypothetical protein Q4G27_02240 [Flavobacteriaceae bacterium]|nr:hypothetical protein [Flavobacteriaceae bacterium]
MSQIFFHTGLSKTGSTFLQQQIFPKLGHIYYLPTKKYRRALDVIPGITADKILISREFDQQFEREIISFSKAYPAAFPIIVFREPGSWAVSNYKRFVKNGHHFSFTEFIDIQGDKGHFKIQDFSYSRYIQLLEKHFEQPPLILIYDDLKKNPHQFLNKIGKYLDIPLEFQTFNLTPSHVSYDENALKLVRKLSSKIQFQKKLEVHRKPKGFLYNLYANIIRYSILYSSKILPEFLFPKEELISAQEVEAVSKFFADEWNFVKEKASKF